MFWVITPLSDVAQTCFRYQNLAMSFTFLMVCVAFQLVEYFLRYCKNRESTENSKSHNLLKNENSKIIQNMTKDSFG